MTVVRTAKKRRDEALEDARRQRDDNLAFDSVWCVYDVDEHPHQHEAKEMAIANGINLAISNPCFELWLVLHFRDSPGAKDRHELQSILRQFDPKYDKHVIHSNYESEYEKAALRATRMDLAAEKRDEPGTNPSTTVYKLTTAIRGQ